MNDLALRVLCMVGLVTLRAVLGESERAIWSIQNITADKIASGAIHPGKIVTEPITAGQAIGWDIIATNVVSGDISRTR